MIDGEVKKGSLEAGMALGREDVEGIGQTYGLVIYRRRHLAHDQGNHGWKDG